MTRTLRLLLWATVYVCSPVIAADPWADRVVDYNMGTNPEEGFLTATASLGAPTAFSNAFGGYVVSPFSAASGTDEVVSVGAGGQLTVMFDEPVTNDPQNPYGIDLLVFGNAFFSTNNFNFDQSTVISGVSAEGGEIWLSENGIDFTQVTGVVADGLYPTNGYADSTEFFPALPGSILADFTRPVNPTLSPNGLGATAVIAAYAGSGGGTGIDLGSYGFSQISYVRVTTPASAIAAPEIDAFADVAPLPEPNGLIQGIWLGWLFLRGRRV